MQVMLEMGIEWDNVLILVHVGTLRGSEDVSKAFCFRREMDPEALTLARPPSHNSPA